MTISKFLFGTGYVDGNYYESVGMSTCKLSFVWTTVSSGYQDVNPTVKVTSHRDVKPACWSIIVDRPYRLARTSLFSECLDGPVNGGTRATAESTTTSPSIAILIRRYRTRVHCTSTLQCVWPCLGCRIVFFYSIFRVVRNNIIILVYFTLTLCGMDYER